MNRTQWSVRTIVAVTALCLVLPLASGCLWAPELGRVVDDLRRQIPGAEFDKEFSISLGPVALGMARMVTGMVGDDDAREVRGYLKGVSRVQVAIYNADQIPAVDGVRMPRRLQMLEEEEGWETIIRVREKEQLVWVMCRVDDKSIREMYVVILDDDELVLAKVGGRLERTAAHALAEARRQAGFPELRDTHRRGKRHGS